MLNEGKGKQAVGKDKVQVPGVGERLEGTFHNMQNQMTALPGVVEDKEQLAFRLMQNNVDNWEFDLFEVVKLTKVKTAVFVFSVTADVFYNAKSCTFRDTLCYSWA